MRKILITLLVLFFLAGPLSRCAYIDPNLIDGAEAKEVIAERIQLNLIIYALSRSTFGTFFTLITPDLIITDEGATYEKDKVEACADQVFFTSFFISTTLSPFVCSVGEYSIQIPLLTQKL